MLFFLVTPHHCHTQLRRESYVAAKHTFFHMEVVLLVPRPLLMLALPLVLSFAFAIVCGVLSLFCGLLPTGEE